MQKTAKDYWFVGAQLVLFLLFAIAPSVIQLALPKIITLTGLILLLLGVLIILRSIFQLSDALTPYPSPKQGASIKTEGLYRFSRHPIYSGILILFLGWGLYTQSLSRLVLTIALYILFYFKSSYEEERLIEAYGEKYRTYRKKTARFFF
ncbi:MAG: isoprenylcysteine carboxylmethyltransferase family protein [Bacteroidota bacterium]